jgi:hypothetical protein
MGHLRYVFQRHRLISSQLFLAPLKIQPHGDENQLVVELRSDFQFRSLISSQQLLAPLKLQPQEGENQLVVKD